MPHEGGCEVAHIGVPTSFERVIAGVTNSADCGELPDSIVRLSTQGLASGIATGPFSASLPEPFQAAADTISGSSSDT